MATGERKDPFRSFNFRLQIDGVDSGGFSECSGLSAESDSVDYREGTDRNPSVRKLTGLIKFANVVLKRGYTINGELWAWYKKIHDGNNDRRNVTITLLNEEHQDVLSWHLDNAWLKKIEGPSFKASGNEIAIESVELIHEGLSIEAASGR
jgi:phage tail-like protein